MKNVKAILLCFEAVLGLKLTSDKREVLVVKADDILLSRLMSILGCKVGPFPTTYLGLPLCIGSTPKSFWDPVLEGKEKKLFSWEVNYLSLGGRVTLILSTLSNLLIYYLSLFKCPVSAISRIERLQRDFLWHVRGLMKKYYLVKWASVC